MKNSFFVVIFICCCVALFSCHTHHSDLAVAATSDTMIVESGQYSAIIDSLDAENYFRPDHNFLPVYQLSPTTIAITFITEDRVYRSYFDSLFFQIYDRDSLDLTDQKAYYARAIRVVDTSGFFKLMIDPSLDDTLRKLTDHYYYIYGTKGVCRCSVQHVIYFFGACGSVCYGLTVDGYDRASCGQPIFSHPMRLALHYGGDYRSVQDSLNAEKTAELLDSTTDYKDHVYPVVFANLDSFYFSYSDDFLWTAKRDTMPSCLFPQRSIVKTHAGELDVQWASFMDNFGIPCD